MSETTLTDVKGEINKNTVIDFYTSFKSMGRSSRQEMNKATETPSDTIVQLRLN